MTLRSLRLAAALGLVTMTGACLNNPAADTGIDSHSLASMQASVWVDPDGCKHWIIDDGVEGYMSPVLNLDGTPDCV
ncbi:MAG: hypothetical protein AAGD13_13390 [Pseudomonadota bacterium]